MKSFSFFNSKGGVGKTTHTIMFASWLRYHEKAKVSVIDLEAVGNWVVQARLSDERLMEKSDSFLARYLASHPRDVDAYPIMTFPLPKDGFTATYLKNLCLKVWEYIESLESDGYDYVLFDFSATLVEYSPCFRIMSEGFIDLFAVPIDTDNMTRKDGIITADIFKRNNQPVVAFWNNVSVEDINRAGFLNRGEEIFIKRGIEVLPQRIKTFQKAKREADARLFVKSTLCWPDRYVEMACPQLPELYAELKSRLDAID